MVSREQAGVFRKHRSAEDKQGNLAWASRVSGKALRVSPEAASRDIEGLFEFDDDEKLLWRVLKLARRYTDLEHAGVFAPDVIRGVLRGLVAADVVDMVEAEEAKALLPAELKRLRAELKGKEWRPSPGGLQARVYRPDISGVGAAVTTPPAAASSEPPSPGVTSQVGPPAPPRPTKPLTPAEKKLREQLATAASTLASVNHYVFLGVPQTADEATIRNAYVQLARDYHPDRLSGTALADDEETRGYVDRLFKRLGDANKTLGTPETRARYDRELAALQKVASPAAGDARPRRPVEARNAYTMAETFFKKKDYKQAEMHYRQAAMFDDGEPLIATALAWCIYLNPDHPEQHRLSDARRRLEEVLKKHKNAEAAYRLGRVLKDAGDDDAAVKRFEEAIRYQPQHVDAQRELRLAEARRQKAQEERQKAEDAKRGLLGKLFKK
jgi:curved DNA-binding protein CbpA